MTIQIYYDSLTQAATAFGCSRQWLSKLIAQGLLVSYEVEGQPQARRVFHQDVAEALARTESGLRPHNCVCYTVAHLQGIEEGRQESAPQLAKVQAGVIGGPWRSSPRSAKSSRRSTRSSQRPPRSWSPTRKRLSRRCLFPFLKPDGVYTPRST